MSSDEEFERLLRATNDVQPRADFAARVMMAVELESSALALAWWTDVPRIAKRAVPVAALAAMLAVAWAVHASGDVDDALVGSFDHMEIDW